MKDKLAEEILNKMVDGFVPYFSESEVIEAMQAYHEANLKEVTDEDIESFASLQSNPESKKDFDRGLWLGIKVGAKAMQNGEIKHNG